MLFVGIALASLAQKNVDEIIEQYSQDKEVEYIHLPRLLIWAGIAQMKASKAAEIACNINDLRILLLDCCRNRKRKKSREKVEQLMQNGYQVFAKMKSSDGDILMIVEGDAEKISEIAAFIIGKRSCKFMQIKGNFNTQDIHVVVDDVRNMQVKA
ncbi:DUF4252 domain-containing protein [Segatella oulorum]|uniref:DUF4252 domain-containing protein n=1 Tax=Segatella oulorum TaxID=28136 RepID=UPI0023EFDF9A|nr:DUF4252 domain-containing protein [Segatella oulorum]